MTTPTDTYDGKRHVLVSLSVADVPSFLAASSRPVTGLLAGEITLFPRLDRTTRLGRLDLAGLIFAAGSVFCLFHHDFDINAMVQNQPKSTHDDAGFHSAFGSSGPVLRAFCTER